MYKTCWQITSLAQKENLSTVSKVILTFGELFDSSFLKPAPERKERSLCTWTFCEAQKQNDLLLHTFQTPTVLCFLSSAESNRVVPTSLRIIFMCHHHKSSSFKFSNPWLKDRKTSQNLCKLMCLAKGHFLLEIQNEINNSARLF